MGARERERKRGRWKEGKDREFTPVPPTFEKGRDSKVARICERARGVGKKGRNTFYLCDGRTRKEIKETERQTEKNELKISKTGNICLKKETNKNRKKLKY